MAQGGLTDWLLQKAGEAAQEIPVLVESGEPLIDLVARLRTSGADTAVVVDEAGTPVGMVGLRDILEKVVYEAPPEDTVATVLDARAPLIGCGEPLFRALARIERERLPALVVVDERGRACGLLRREAVLARGHGDLLGRLAATAPDETVATPVAGRAAQAAIVSALLEAHQPVTDVLRLVNAMDLDMIARVAAAAVSSLRADGWGEPPVDFAVIVMGSAGRGESLLCPDQDNGFILADYPDEEHGGIDGYFIELAERFTRDLALAGFPLCRGNVMATNPVWRKTLTQWCDQISGWTRRRSNVAILAADIFFDFRCACGNLALAAELRTHVTRIARESPAFLNQLLWQQAEQGSVVGLFGRLITSDEAPHSGRLDLKLNGLVPLVELVRLLALRAGIAETGTLARLAALRDAGHLAGEDEAELREGFAFLSGLLLHQQVADWRAGREPGNHVAPAALPRWQREHLVATLRAIEGIRRRVTDSLVQSGTLGAAG